MDLILYNNKAEKNRVDKTDYLNGILTLSGTLRNACSIINPSIIINIKSSVKVLDDDSNNVLDDSSTYVLYDYMDKFLGCNYVHIPDFNRYYFVDNITSINQDLWQIDLTVDVLMSFKDNIEGLSVLVKRNENLYDYAIKDENLSYKYNKVIDVSVPDVTSGVTLDTFNTELTSPYYVITYSGRPYPLYDSTDVDIINGVKTNYIPAVNSKIAGVQAQDKVALIDAANLFILNNYFIQNSDKIGFLKSVIAIPYTITPASTDELDLYMGTSQVQYTVTATGSVYSAKVRKIPHVISPRLKLADFTLTKLADFLDYEPYTTYELYLPYKGWITLSANEIINERIYVYYVMDYHTGEASIDVVTGSGKSLYQGNCQLGVQLGFTSTNIRQISDSVSAGVLNSLIQTVGAAISKNGYQGANALNTLGRFTNFSDYRVTGECNVQSGYMGLYGQQIVTLKVTKVVPQDDYRTTAYKKLYGLPLNQYKELSDLSGYTECDNFHLEDFDSATSTEIDSIDALLKSGIIL